MSCEKIRGLILTDYIDNEMNDEERMRLNIHFADCPGCREFFERVQNTVVTPFAGAEKIEAPEVIWHRIKEAIIAERQTRAGFLAGLLAKLISHFYIPRPALAMSAIMAVAFIVVLATAPRFRTQGAPRTNREDRFEYSTYSVETPVSALLNNDGGFGTSIEEMFL